MESRVTIKLIILYTLLFSSCSSVVNSERKALSESRKIAKIALNRTAFLLDSIYDNRIGVYDVSKLPDSIYLNRWMNKREVELMAKGIKDIDHVEQDYLFNDESIESYKKQLSTFDLEFITNKEFVNNKLKHFSSQGRRSNRIDTLLSRRIIMSSPVYTKNGKYALFYFTSGEFTSLWIFKKNKSWKSYRSVSYIVFEPIYD